MKLSLETNGGRVFWWLFGFACGLMLGAYLASPTLVAARRGAVPL